MNYNFNSEFCNYNQSCNLEKIGFDKPCLGYYNSDNVEQVVRVIESISKSTKSQYIDMYEKNLDSVVSAPLLQQAFKFFIDNGYYNDVKKIDDFKWQFVIESKNIFYSQHFNNHKECVSACLDKLIQLHTNCFLPRLRTKNFEEVKNFLNENHLFTFYGSDELIEEFLKIKN